MYTHQRLHHEPHGVIERRDDEDDALGELVRAGAHGEPRFFRQYRVVSRPFPQACRSLGFYHV